jgi:hypothetical protein
MTGTMTGASHGTVNMEIASRITTCNSAKKTNGVTAPGARKGALAAASASK